MGVAGAWRASAVTPLEYAGATRWGTGVNPVHAIPDSHKPTASREPLGSTEWSGAAPEEILGPVQWGYCAEDQQFYGGEDYRYLSDDHPNWREGGSPGHRRDGTGDRYSGHGNVAPWPGWGPYNDDNPVDGFPVSGPPGGLGVHAESDGTEVENSRAIAVPTPGYTGGWQSKAHQEINEARTSDPAQYEINTSLVQLHRSLDNSRAVVRGQDDARTSITNRLTGMKVKPFAKSFGMGGGPGTPDMYPRQQDLPYRPFYFRHGKTPPPEEHTYSEIEYRAGVERSVPADAGEYVTVRENVQGDGYGYTSEDGGFY